MGTGRLAPALAVTVGAVTSCTSPERPPHLEDAARATIPVPACIVALAPRAQTGGAVRNLAEDEIWRVVFPVYDASKHRLPVDAAACTGERILEDPLFGGATPHGAPIEVREGDVVFGNAGDRVRIVWLRTHRWPDGSEGGPLALVRASESVAELYALGAYRRWTDKTTLQAERLGAEFLVSVADDGCEGQPKTNACTSSVTLYLPRQGRLGRLQTLTTEQRAYATGTEPGVVGPLQYRLTASPEYANAGLKIFEQIEATDSAGRVLHKMELERTFVLRDGALEGGPESLWARVQGQPAAPRRRTTSAPNERTP